MRCPKCGYNSFEYLDSCKKCGIDLGGYKVSHGLRATILPFLPPEPTLDALAELQPDICTSGTGMGEVSEPEPAGDGGHHFSPEQFSQEPDPFSFGIELAGNEGELRTESPFTDSFPDILQDAKGPLVSDFQTDAAEEIASLPEDSPAPEAEGISFAEFSFDEEKYEEQEYLQIGPASATPATADAGKNDSTKLEPMEFLFNDFEFVSEEPSVNKNETIETVDPIGFGEVLLEDISEGQAEGQEEIDTMGLSVEEYESLFGELPPRRKVN